jgi:RHH-type proline utilization regulon transcriptional repressor/proline dehydrogenase/delta 1-pyrroline-5-carboxylate dehydrogenase
MAQASEQQIKSIGRQIFERMEGEKPSVFKKDWWSGKMMDFAMKDDDFKVQMFRFTDVFPTLKDHVQVAEHLQEYFVRDDVELPGFMEWGIAKVKPDSRIAKMAAGQIEKQIKGMASNFIAGQDAREALPTLEKMWKSEMCFTLDLLGEATVSEKEAQYYFDRYEEILDTLIEAAPDWKAQPTLEQAAWGELPRINLSVKISSLFSQMDAIDFDGSVKAVKERLRPLFRKAQEHGAFINIDMESYKDKDLTLAIFKSLLEEPEFASFEHAGIVIQAYLHDAVDDVEELCAWARERGTPVTVRLVKGAYWDYETIHARQEGWVCPVFSKKWQTDQSYERCTRILLDNHEHLHTAIGSHNVRSIAHAMAYAQELGIPQDGIEFQMLYGMAEPMKAAVSNMGYRLRDYVPIGEMIPGMAYLVRRLLENTSNESWLRMSFAEDASIDDLLSEPAPAEGGNTELPEAERFDDPITDHGFRNEPVLDFAHAENRQRFETALSEVEAQFGDIYPVVIANQDYESPELIESTNPCRVEQTVGKVHRATIEHADEAIKAAWSAKDAWAATPGPQRAEHIMRIGDGLRRRRDELAAWMVYEAGKTWREADADVCEAIDFCDFYAREMKRLSDPKKLGDVPGEHNIMWYQPRGVVGVIAPWNFPLAILTGMTMAAAVTGNTVIMKPAEQTPVIAAKLMEIVRESGLPSGVINFVPGYGHDVGNHLVESPYIHQIAFTGSMEVGLQILAKCGQTDPNRQQKVKEVVCEMGGKNAIIVDADADLDEAVQGVVQSAFGFQGQKCSACSRAVVHESCYEEFRERLVEATRSLIIGPAHDPANRVSAVIDEDARSKIESYIELGAEEGDILVSREVPDGGHFVGPTVVDNITPQHRLAHEEVFGPVLALMKVSSFDEALQVANGTRYALTGGVYSRSPENIERAYRDFNVGNLYINRSCTGALVYRQPFGGFKMSGTGTKAGGPDYLLRFMEPRSVSENTMRRGFAPSEHL